jgi:hypothetical protein
MHRLFSSLLIFWLAPPFLGITTPSSGAVLRGPVNITGDNQVQAGVFSYSEVAFAYADDPTGTWFLISATDQIVDGGTLAIWDTRRITDGDYSLRLRVYLQDGNTVDVTVTNLHVRNDAAASTATPPVASEDLPTLAAALPTSTLEPAPVTSAFFTPAPPPGNPASLTDGSVLSTFRRGAIFALIAFILIGIFLRLRAAR